MITTKTLTARQQETITKVDEYRKLNPTATIRDACVATGMSKTLYFDVKRALGIKGKRGPYSYGNRVMPKQ